MVDGVGLLVPGVSPCRRSWRPRPRDAQQGLPREAEVACGVAAGRCRRAPWWSGWTRRTPARRAAPPARQPYWSDARNAWARASSVLRPPAAKACAATGRVRVRRCRPRSRSGAVAGAGSRQPVEGLAGAAVGARRRRAPGRRSAVASGSLTHASPSSRCRKPPSAHCWSRRTSDRGGAPPPRPARTSASRASDCPMASE